MDRNCKHENEEGMPLLGYIEWKTVSLESVV